jgi:hypothetical protein
MAGRRTVSVGPHKNDDKVQVKIGGAERALRLFDTKKEALPFAHAIAKKLDAELIELRLKDGKIMNPDSFGGDPRSIIDKKH